MKTQDGEYELGGAVGDRHNHVWDRANAAV